MPQCLICGVQSGKDPVCVAEVSNRTLLDSSSIEKKIVHREPKKIAECVHYQSLPEDADAWEGIAMTPALTAFFTLRENELPF